MLYNIASFICYLYFKLFHKLNITGLEHIPKDGPLVICPNHIHNFDPPLVAGVTFRIRPISFMAKSELFKYKWVAYLLRKVGAFPVNRGKSDRQAMKDAMDVLRNGKCLGVFPEGKRSKTGELLEGSSGAALFALKNNAPIIPVAIKGEYKLFKPLTIVIGKPSSIDEYRKEKISFEDSQGAIKVVMNDIKVLLDGIDNK